MRGGLATTITITNNNHNKILYYRYLDKSQNTKTNMDKRSLRALWALTTSWRTNMEQLLHKYSKISKQIFQPTYRGDGLGFDPSYAFHSVGNKYGGPVAGSEWRFHCHGW